jgi:hypothetical protein
MKKLLFCLFMGSLILMLGCSENSPLLPGNEPVQQESLKKSANKPMAKLIGFTEEVLWFDETTGAPFSIGTITFEDMGTYDLVYQILEMSGKGNSSVGFLTERFYIYEENTIDLDAEEFNIWDILAMDNLMTGINSGVSPNGKIFVTNGSVSEANGEFEGWVGRNVHVQGDIVGPMSFTSKFRVN